MPPKRSKIGYPKRKKKPPPHGDIWLGPSAAKTTTIPVCTTNMRTNREVIHGGFPSNHQQRNHRPIQQQWQIQQKADACTVTRDLLQILIELDEMEEGVLKKAVSAIRNHQLESALEQVRSGFMQYTL